MNELWQLYDENAKPIKSKGASKDDVFGKGLLHGAAHVWIWRRLAGGIEILVQRRSATKRTWPNLLDISAAGHIDLGEEPVTAAIRETKEELGLTIKASDLQFIKTLKAHMVSGNGAIENEYRWIYLLELTSDEVFSLPKSEVASLTWVNLATFSKEAYDPERYVPQGKEYFDTIIAAIANS